MKLVASDFDGTLYRNGTVTEEEKQAISNWRKNGNLFGVVTGRNYRFLRADLDGFNIEYDFIISTNGALIRDNNENVISSSEGDISIAKEVLDLTIKNNAVWFEIMYLDSYERDVIKFRKPTDELIANEEILKEADYFHQLSCTIPDVNRGIELTAEINERFKGKISAYSLIYGTCTNIDMVKYGTSKASALYEYAKIKGVDPKDIITVGDNFNDIPMVKEFDGYIMSSAIEAVKSQANKTCDTLCDILK